MQKLLGADTMTKPNIQTFLIPEDGNFPNNDALPLILMRQVFDPKTKNLVQTIEKTFHANAWERSWRNGIYDFHHYHSTAHEVLGLYAGRVKAQFGGPDGKKYKHLPFKNLLISISDKEMHEQGLKLEREFEQWKGDMDQVDDVLVIGLKF